VELISLKFSPHEKKQSLSWFQVATGLAMREAFEMRTVKDWLMNGTEIMNSTRAPATQSFCMGVWHKTGAVSYVLNHFALSFDSNGTFVGPAREDIILAKKADHYRGTFTIDTIPRATFFSM